MALHTELDIFRACFDLAGEAVDVVLQMRRDVKPVLGRTIEFENWHLYRHQRTGNTKGTITWMEWKKIL